MSSFAWEPQPLIKNPRTAKSAKKEADRWVSNAVRESRDWVCDFCSNAFPPPGSILQCSHFYSRIHNSTRFDPENLFAHCAECHGWLEYRRPDFTEHYKDIFGSQAYDELMTRHHGTVSYRKQDFMDISAHFYIEFYRIRELRVGGQGGLIQLESYDG